MRCDGQVSSTRTVPVVDVERAELVAVVREGDDVAGRRADQVGDASDVAAT